MSEDIVCTECGHEAWDGEVPRGYRGSMCTGSGTEGCKENIRDEDSITKYWYARAVAAEMREAQLRNKVIALAKACKRREAEFMAAAQGGGDAEAQEIEFTDAHEARQEAIADLIAMVQI